MTAVLRDQKTNSHTEKLSKKGKFISNRSTKEDTLCQPLRIFIMLYLLLDVTTLQKDQYDNRERLCTLTKLLDSI